VNERAYAKATLTLRVLGVRDDGYHELEALTVTMSEPYDNVIIERIAGDRVELEVDPAHDDVPTDETNLAWRAAALAGGGARIHLHKQIPTQAGLGGGSADAAAVLRALDAPEWLAAQIGSDVPFCRAGGTAWMRGRGEIIEAIDPAPTGYQVIVVVPPFGAATRAVYGRWDELGAPAARRRIEPPAPVRPYTDALFNDLEPAAEEVEPRLRPWRENLEAVAGRPAVMAGSGSAYLIVVDESPETSAFVATVAQQLAGSQIWLAIPLGTGFGPPGGQAEGR
jgi:4-diphosphocytidyl-2-C-methyl-D-erythritol kinase